MNGRTEETGADFPRDAILRFSYLPKGDEGIEHTAAAMIAVIRHAVEVGEVEAVNPAGMGSDHGATPDEFANALWHWLRASVEFERDPEHVELIRTPAQMFDELDARGKISVDCDENVVLACAILEAHGVGAGFATISKPGKRQFVHVLPMFRRRSGELVPMDAQEGVKPGAWPPFGRARVFEVSQ